MTLNHPLPDGVRRGWGGVYHEPVHEFLQHDGRWVICGGRRVCRECIREDEMKTTLSRLREALVEHFGYAYFVEQAVDAPLFGEQLKGNGRELGDHHDRIDMLETIDREFGIFLPEDAVMGVPTLASLVAAIEAASDGE